MKHWYKRLLILGAALALMPAAELLAQSADDGDDTGTDTTLVPEPAQPAERAASALFVDVAHAGPNLVAIGQWGDILISSDGSQWRQVADPVDTTLTRL